MKKDSNFVTSAIQHRRLIYFLIAIMVAFGIYSLFAINKDEFPTFQIKDGLVVGVYPGANAQEVEEQLTKPLEEIRRLSENAVQVLLDRGVKAIVIACGTVSTTALENRTEDMRQKAGQLENENRELETRIEELGSDKSVVEIAQEELGLVAPGAVVIEPEPQG